MANERWWKGRRGEWYVVVQAAMLVLLAVGPRSWNGWPPWPFPAGRWVWFAGAGLMIAGFSLVAAGVRQMGKALTALPCPAEGAPLIETGVFRVVRHPMYAGVILLAFGWALLIHGWLTLGYAAAGCVFLDIKSRREERWLVERFPGCPAYQRRVRKLVPFIY